MRAAASSGTHLFLVTMWLCSHVLSSGANAPLDYLDKHTSQYTKELIDLVNIPSISSLPEHHTDILSAAKWLQGRLKTAGLEEVKIYPTKSQPLVFGQWLHAKGAPTVLIYGHYDVQPVDPLELWNNKPFDAKLVNGEFLGRGAADDKGGLLQPIQAVEALLKSEGKLPVNVKFLLEGQEEIGSPDFETFLTQNGKLLQADYALSADGGQNFRDQGGLAIGLRGAITVEVELQTLASDQHSGMKGGTVLNPINALAKLLAGMVDDDHHITVEGFYDDVRPLTSEDKADLAAFPFDEEAEFQALGGALPVGEKGFTTLERRWLRPTLDVVGIWGGFQGAGVKTIVPSKATAKVSCRLVPNQDPDKIVQALEAHMDRHAPHGAKVTFRLLGFKAHPYSMPKDTIVNKAAAKVLEEVMGKPTLFYREGGTIPAMALLKNVLDIDMTMFSFGLPDDRIHAPNERYVESMYKMGRVAYVKLLQSIGGLAQQEEYHDGSEL
ncbi:TPA: hypothetical protein ACH3X2_008556 [Trebouxia sp. C0005]